MQLLCSSGTFSRYPDRNYPGTISLEAPAFDANDNVDVARLHASLENLRNLAG
jgi:hypothetical protein